MTGSIYLIVEDRSDIQIVKAILQARNISVQIVPLAPSGGRGGVSRLAAQIEDLIQSAIKSKKPNDCIAVLHDADNLTRPHDRADYDKIRQICEKYKRDVVLVIAHDTIESWLLADSGLCKWLSEKPRNWDTQAKPKDSLSSLLDRKNKGKYQGGNIAKILAKLDGSGDNHSPSMKSAMQHLHNAPCVRT